MEWRIALDEEDAPLELARRAGVSGLTARVLMARGIDEPAACERFLNLRLDHLHHPSLMPAMDEAVEVVSSALRNGGRVVVYSDYDVDGLTSAALLVRFISLLGAKAGVYIPNRIDEGYGINLDAARRIAEEGCSLLIAADCGTNDTEAVEYLHSQGVKTVILDHHEVSSSGPAAGVVVNPKLPGSSYPFRELAAVGVVFKFAWALAERLSPGRKVSERMRNFLLEAVALAALGTVADVVPLVDENRVLVAYGLQVLRQTRDPALSVLIDKSGVKKEKLGVGDIAFRIGPRLNAAGRLDDAYVALDALCGVDPTVVEGSVAALNGLNNRRQRLQERITAEALEAVRGEDPSAVVLARPGWHPGVVGIAASRVVEALNVPAILMCVEGETARGSARSVEGFDLVSALADCSDLLERWGGHKMAAGLRMPAANVDALRDALEEKVRECFGGEPPPRVLRIDALTTMEELTVPAVKELQRLGPFGTGNPAPVFAMRRVRVAGEPSAVGGGEHLGVFFTREDYDGAVRGVWWRCPAAARRAFTRGALLDVAFGVRVNEWNGRRSVELDIKDVREASS